MKRAIIFEKGEDVTATVLPVVERCLGRPKCIVDCPEVPDFANQGGLCVGDRLVLHIEQLGIWEDYIFMGRDKPNGRFYFASVATW